MGANGAKYELEWLNPLPQPMFFFFLLGSQWLKMRIKTKKGVGGGCLCSGCKGEARANTFPFFAVVDVCVCCVCYSEGVWELSGTCDACPEAQRS